VIINFGILNLSPDSFSDGEDFDLDFFYNKAQTLINSGFDVIDVGAESTRPGASIINPKEEWARLKDFLLRYNLSKPLSLDSFKPETIKNALYYNSSISYINDVTGLHNPDLVYQVAEHAESFVKLIAMHSKGGVPPGLRASEIPDEFYDEDGGLKENLLVFFHESIKTCKKFQIDSSRLILDLGLGFGKNLKHSFELLDLIPEIKKEFGLPVMIGASRKNFLRLWKSSPNAQWAELDSWTKEYNSLGIRAGAEYLRSHSNPISAKIA
jgi:dihydropteroate synthase